MAILEVVIAHFFVGESLVSLGEFHKTLIEHINRFVLSGIRSDLVGVVDKRKTLIMSGNRFFVGALIGCVSVPAWGKK
jgi:hypothetical protein